MTARIAVRHNEYRDSVQLMFATAVLRKQPGVEQALIAMGTPANQAIFRELGFDAGELSTAGPDDLVVGVIATDDAAWNGALAELDRVLRGPQSPAGAQQRHRTLEAALAARPEANFCVISVPGAFAAAEAEKALRAGLHVLIFSDNVPLEHERGIKQLARQCGLLCMGPDCGVANINGLAFLVGSIVRKGPIGICGASGAGIQQVAALVHLAGSGVSQAIGTGGRDLRDEIGGLTMLSGIDALEADPETEVIVLISRRPGLRTRDQVLERVSACRKPVVVHFIGCDAGRVGRSGGIAATNLEEAARRALERLGIGFPETDEPLALARGAAKGLAERQRFVRGLFCGGTLCEEAMTVMTPLIGDIFSNAPLRPDLKLASATTSVGHSIVDYGEEEFTLGRPHPVLDPEIRRLGLVREADDPETAVILLDFILGPAVHRDPVGAFIADIRAAFATAASRGGRLAMVASVCGTDADPQNRSAQIRMLRDAGVLVAPSNVQAAKLAGEIIRLRNGGQ